jgi:hypothetical protein
MYNVSAPNWKIYAGEWVISKDLWPTKLTDFIPATFHPVGSTEGKCLQEQALHHQEPKKNICQEIAATHADIL